jgi:hypothetical protein
LKAREALEDKEDKFEENKREEVQEEDKKEETPTNEETAGE